MYCYYDLLPFLQRYQQHNVCYSPKLYLLVELLSFHGASSNTRFSSSKKRFLLWNLLSFHGASFIINFFSLIKLFLVYAFARIGNAWSCKSTTVASFLDAIVTKNKRDDLFARIGNAWSCKNTIGTSLLKVVWTPFYIQSVGIVTKNKRYDYFFVHFCRFHHCHYYVDGKQ